MMSKSPDLDPIVLDDIDPTSEWVEETEDPVFEADFDIDMALAGDEADYVAASEPGKAKNQWKALVVQVDKLVLPLGPLLLSLVALILRLQIRLRHPQTLNQMMSM
jgi:hypothetical protein